MDLRDAREQSWSLEGHSEVPYEQQELLRLAIVKQEHLKNNINPIFLT